MLSILEYIEENVVGRDAGFYGPYGERKGKHHFSFSRKNGSLRLNIILQTLQSNLSLTLREKQSIFLKTSLFRMRRKPHSCVITWLTIDVDRYRLKQQSDTASLGVNIIQ